MYWDVLYALVYLHYLNLHKYGVVTSIFLILQLMRNLWLNL